jgi:hypothetical protein
MYSMLWTMKDGHIQAVRIYMSRQKIMDFILRIIRLNSNFNCLCKIYSSQNLGYNSLEVPSSVVYPYQHDQTCVMHPSSTNVETLS